MNEGMSDFDRYQNYLKEVKKNFTDLFEIIYKSSGCKFIICKWQHKDYSAKESTDNNWGEIRNITLKEWRTTEILTFSNGKFTLKTYQYGNLTNEEDDIAPEIVEKITAKIKNEIDNEIKRREEAKQKIDGRYLWSIANTLRNNEQ